MRDDELRFQIASAESEVDAVAGQWDELAIAAAAPYAAPGWCMSWWQHVADPAASLRVVLVFRGPRLIAVAPMFTRRDRLGIVRYAFLGAGTSPRVQPVARPCDQDDAAKTIALALASAQPRPDVVAFDGTPVAQAWASRVHAQWPSTGAIKVRTRSLPAPGVALDLVDDEPWLQTKSRNFRQQARRRRRHLTGEGMTFELAATQRAVLERLPAFERLHQARFQYRGGSDVLNSDVMQMLEAAAGRLTAGDRLRLWTIENGDRVISAHLFVAAGTEISYWLGGFDDRWGSEQPALQTLIAAIEQAAAAGATRVDLGPGAQHYKVRLGDHEQHLEWAMVFPPGRRRFAAYTVTMAPQMIASLRQWTIQAIPTEAKHWLKRRLRRRDADD